MTLDESTHGGSGSARPSTASGGGDDIRSKAGAPWPYRRGPGPPYPGRHGRNVEVPAAQRRCEVEAQGWCICHYHWRVGSWAGSSTQKREVT